MIKEKGEILVIAIAAMGLMLFTVLSLIAGAQIYFANTAYSVDAERAIALAEAGIDKAITSFNKLGNGYTGQEGEVFLGNGSFDVVITTKDAGTKIIESTGYIPNKTKPKVKRTVRIEASQGVGISFPYGIQVGEGGLDLNSNNRVEGSIYSNGPVTANSTNQITGDAWVAAAPPATPQQETDCEEGTSNCQNFIFGRNEEGQLRLDVAQSFKPTMTIGLSKASLKIKKIGSPADATVRIMEDKNGEPDKIKVSATGTLYANLVTPSYSFVDVTFDGVPNLDQDKTYWLMVDTSSDAINYWSWQKDFAQSYNRGVPMWSPNWRSTGNPDWNSFSGDLSFKIYLGGTVNSLKGNSNFEVGGNAHANTIEKVNIAGDAYYQTIINSTVGGESFPGSEDPPPKTYPISEGNINAWKAQAQAAGVNTGDMYIDEPDCPLTLESQKIVGNVYVNSNCRGSKKITVKSPIWITGNLTLNSNIDVKLHPDLGGSSGIIIVGNEEGTTGLVDLTSNIKMEGTGVGSSLLMVLSTYNSRTNDITAIKVNSNGVTGAFYADKGIIEPGSGNIFKELTAWKIRLVSNSTINYETGLSSTLFSSGPGGSYTLVKGTYQVR